MTEKQTKKQTPDDVFIQTILDENTQKTITIAQLNAKIADLDLQFKDLLSKYQGMPENHSKKNK